MILLHLGIGEGDIKTKSFFTLVELVSYLKKELSKYDCVFLATEDGEKGELLITEKLETLIFAISKGYFNLLWNSPQNFHLHQYETYEDAYSVALHMKEENKKCYNEK
jgi:hypothetical protein